MILEQIDFRELNLYNKLIRDYLNQDQKVSILVNNHYNLEGIEKQIKEKSNAYTLEHRKKLCHVLYETYKNIDISPKQKEHLDLLSLENTYTITTGHQLNIFTGPVYYLYKIIHTLAVVQRLNKKIKNNHLVPIFWMASEDHDIEEINHFTVKGKTFRWDKNTENAVGRIDTNGLDLLLEIFKKNIDSSLNATYLVELFKKNYLDKNKTLAQATFGLLQDLFNPYGLLILDGDNPILKKMLIPIFKNEIEHHIIHKKVSKTNDYLKKNNYPIQVNPRLINLFYFENNLRKRIVRDGHFYEILDTKVRFDKTGILNQLQHYPEKFSPNALMRPIYQEAILPNIAYIGGAGELSYWMQLKSVFDALEIPFPVLMLRHSFLIIDEKNKKKIGKLGLTYRDLFLERNHFINKRIRQISNIDIDVSILKTNLKENFKYLYNLANQTDPSFYGAVKAQEVKQLLALEYLEKRLLKAQKRVLKDELERALKIKDHLFPLGKLQERTSNFSEFYLERGACFIPSLIKEIDSMNPQYLIFS